MDRVWIIMILLLFSRSFCVSGAGKVEYKVLLNPGDAAPADSASYMYDDKWFVDAFEEFSEMLDGKCPMSLKRAEFLVEWAYLQGNVAYEDFCQQIDSVTGILNAFIELNNLRRYKTGVNYALFEYFTKPNPLNGYTPMTYDFEDFRGKNDFRKLFVSKLMKEKKGQCMSLCLYYKILCDELEGEGYLAMAPSHIYIKHIGEDGKWVDIDLTNGHFARDEWIMETLGVSTESIKNNVYMCALSETETIAIMLIQLANAYVQKYGGYDYFTLNCAKKALQYYPSCPVALMVASNTYAELGMNYVRKIGKVPSEFIFRIHNGYVNANKEIERIGAKCLSDGEYERLVEKALKKMGR